jgi:hypothetical protein
MFEPSNHTLVGRFVNRADISSRIVRSCDDVLEIVRPRDDRPDNVSTSKPGFAKGRSLRRIARAEEDVAQLRTSSGP